MTTADLSHRSIRETIAARGTGGDPSWQDEDGKRTALIELCISTPVMAAEYVSVDAVAQNLTDNAAEAEGRAAALRRLQEDGWTLQAPFVADDGDGYVDCYIRMRKRLPHEDEVLWDAAQACGATEQHGFSIGWGPDEGAAPAAADTA